MNHETVNNNPQQNTTKLKHHHHQDVAATAATATTSGASRTDQGQKHALAVAVATAEAAMATAQAAVEVARLNKPSANHAREHYAAIVIQTAFRGYLVRECTFAVCT